MSSSSEEKSELVDATGVRLLLRNGEIQSVVLPNFKLELAGMTRDDVLQLKQDLIVSLSFIRLYLFVGEGVEPLSVEWEQFPFKPA